MSGSAPSGASIGQGINDIGSGIGDLYTASGDFQEANSYENAAAIAAQNATLAAESTRVQEQVAGRQINETIGTQKADVAAAGFSASGSSIALLQASAEQGAQTTALIGIQGNITQLGYEQQSNAYAGEAAAANAAGHGATAAGIGSILGGIVSFL